MNAFSYFMMAALLTIGCQAKKTTGSAGPSGADIATNKPLEGTYWVLTELEGQPVKAPEPGEKPSYIYLNSADKTVSVSGGCNGMGGNYELINGNRIRFGQMISTMMACPDMTKEEGLKKMTGMADQYAIQGDMLSFFKGRMAPFARFKAMPRPDGFKLN